MNDISTLLRFVNVQTAAEGFLSEAVNTDTRLVNALKLGNRHASVFTASVAEQFAKDYVVVDHKSNTTTGFSGTLFRNKTTNELILSFRSTEFVDDSLRDAKATGDLEIARLGWALGQISDMENFYAELKATNKIGPTDTFYVTGYSLGGHLATAFNLLRQEQGEAERIVHTYTFNGAGTGGLVGSASLQGIVTDFRNWWKNPAAIPWANFSSSERKQLEKEAQARVDELMGEQARLTSLNVNFSPRPETLAAATAALDFNYQLAALAATFHRTTASSNFPMPSGENFLPIAPVFAISRIPNMTEIVGEEAGRLGLSFISNSGVP